MSSHDLRPCCSALLALAALPGTSGSLPAVRAEPVRPDRVEDLRHALRFATAEARLLEQRMPRVERRAAALRSIGELFRAVLLEEWPDAERDGGRPGVLALRDALARRLGDALREVLRDGDPPARLAAVAMLGELGAAARAARFARPKIPEHLSRTVAETLLQQVKEGESPFRAAAAQALGHVPVDPKTLVGSLNGLLGSDEAALRRAAAGCLATRLRAEVRDARVGHGSSRAQVFQAVRSILPAAGQALPGPDRHARRQLLEVVRAAAEALTEQAGNHEAGEDLPPDDEPLTDGELARFRHVAERLRQDRAQFLPLAQVLSDQVPAVARALGDRDPAVCEAASQAIEAVATVRLKLRGQAADLARVGDKAVAAGPGGDPLATLAAAVDGLGKLLAAPDVEVRLAALYALETLEGMAAPVAADVLKALQDTDPFVRWAAVRTLGKLAPAKPGPTTRVAAALARLLDHEKNGDVRLAAVAALQAYGPQARPAVAALGRLVRSADPDTRIRAIDALLAVGTEARTAGPDLAAALAAADAAVRVAAARALGRFGPPTPETVSPLRHALLDPDAAVRRAASEALLVRR